MLAMHAPDGFLEPPVAAVMGILSVAVLMYTFRVSQRSFNERQIPLAGLAAAFVFAAQMINFPIGAGTSGHLLGAALVAILLGPEMGSLVIAVVVVVQALLFADGGLTALGYNVFNMAIVPVFGGWAIYQLIRRVLPRNAGGVVAAAGIAGGFSIVLSAMALSLEWLFGASAPVPFDDVFAAMVSVHVLIGLAEGVITATMIATIVATRPDLVAGARDLTPAQQRQRQRLGSRAFIVSGALVCVVLAMVVSQFAASSPDGLESVASEKGIPSVAASNRTGYAVFAEYATSGLTNPNLSLAIAGLAGVVVVGLVALGLATASRRSRPAM